MDAVAQPVLGYMEYGVLGLTIIMLAYAVVRLYADNFNLREKLDAVFRENTATITALSTAIRDAAGANSAALQRLTDALDVARRLEALERIRTGRNEDK